MPSALARQCDVKLPSPAINCARCGCGGHLRGENSRRCMCSSQNTPCRMPERSTLRPCGKLGVDYLRKLAIIGAQLVQATLPMKAAGELKTSSDPEECLKRGRFLKEVASCTFVTRAANRRAAGRRLRPPAETSWPIRSLASAFPAVRRPSGANRDLSAPTELSAALGRGAEKDGRRPPRRDDQTAANSDRMFDASSYAGSRIHGM